jgi:hypothetical protein
MVAGEEPTLPVYRDEDCDIGELLGEGTFAQVFDGLLQNGRSSGKTAVAFKVVKPPSLIDFTGCEGEVCYLTPQPSSLKPQASTLHPQP